jgi:hypothetical protein
LAQVIRGGLPNSGGNLLNYDCQWGAFHEIHARYTTFFFVKNHYTKFHENPTTGLVVDITLQSHTRTRTDGRTSITHTALILLRKESLLTNKITFFDRDKITFLGDMNYMYT